MTDYVPQPKGESRIADFMYYCQHFSWGNPRKKPLRDATINRYYRGLMLAQKLIGHSIETVSEEDQLRLMEKLRGYKQGTRKVTIEIYQRYVAYQIRKGYFDGPNLIFGKEEEIIGEFEPVQVHVKSIYQIRRFLNRIHTPSLRVMFGLMYYGGLTAEEIASLKTEAVTETGVFVHRRVQDRIQHLPLPPKFLREVQEFAQTQGEKLFDIPETDRGRGKIVSLFTAAKNEAHYLQDMTMKDFRRSGIKHFYEQCYDVELTKQFAGVEKIHGGWLDTLRDETSFYMEAVAKGRKYYGKSKKVESVKS